MGRTVVIVSLSVVVITQAFTRQGQVGQWKNYTDMKDVRSVAYAPGRIFAATGGGMFMVDEVTGKYMQWTNSENLSANDLTALMIDGAGRVWVGSASGTIDVYSQSSNSWQSITDIAASTRPQKAVHEFIERGDSVYVMSEFGVSVFKVSRWEFGDTYSSFGFVVQPSITSLAVTATTIYVGTTQGLAVAPLTSPNLSSPSSWTIFSQPQGLPSGGVTALAVFHDTLLVGTSTGVYFFDGSSFQLIGSTGGKNVVNIVALQTAYEYVWNTGSAFRVESASGVPQTTLLVASNDTLSATSLALARGDSTLYVGTHEGVAEWNGSAWTIRVPNGPASSQFVGLVVDAKGRLWSASGFSGRGVGFYRFDPSLPEGERWKNYTSSDPTQPGPQNDFYRASLGVNGTIWMSTWGDGVVEVADDTIRRRITTLTTPSLSTAVTSNPLYAVVGGVAADPEGNTWFVNRLAVNGNYLAELVNDTTFHYVGSSTIASQGDFSAIVIDQNGTKWLANSEPSQKPATGLYFYNEALTVQGTQSTAGWGLMTISDGLPNMVVLSLAVDQDNSVWVGTDLGVTIISDPLNPFNSMFSSFPLREQSIQTIAVDGLNNKWIGTKQGVFVVNSDGTQLLNQYTVLNTAGKLVDNDIRSIAIDQRRGIAYIGTQNGLSALSIPAVQPQQAYTVLTFGPNPYTIPNAQPLAIKNLVSNSTIKILAVNGTEITEFAAQGGGRAFWDGRDRRGNLVSSGIYFVVAYADNGNQVASGKVAVIRK